MKKFLLKIPAALLGLGLGYSAAAQQPEREGMPNAKVQSTYESAGTIAFKYVDGTAEYTFTSGRMMGAGGMDLSYTARKIGDELYLLSWHDETNSNYITQVLDFANMKEYHTAIMFYGTEMQQINFTEGVIDKVTWLE